MNSLIKKGRPIKKRGQVIERVDDDLYRVRFDDGKNRTYDYEELIELANHDDEEGVERWTFEKILNHQYSKDPKRKGRIDVQVKWQGFEEPTWEPMEVIKKDDPVTLAQYAKSKELLDQAKWKWAYKYVKNDQKMQRMLRQMNLAKKRKVGIKYQFGIRVPRTIKEAYELDKLNNDTAWADAIEKEVRLLYDLFECFKLVPENEGPPEGYNKIPLLWAFAVKYDGRRRARCVAGGHKTPDLDEDLYSGVVNLETVRLAFIAAILMDLKVIAADVSSAYINAFTTEKVYVIAGPEFGQLEGRKLIIVRALYGLKSSGARWHQKLADNLRDMGFYQCKADFDLWIRNMGDHYEYVAVIVDDLLIFSKDPDEIIKDLEKVFGYELKGVGTPEYYNGADIEFDEDRNCWTMSAKTYIKNVCERIEKLLNVTLKNYDSPLIVGDHPELDESDLMAGSEISIYQMLIGCAQWAVTLGRYDIQYATNTLARFANMPRDGHYQRALRLFGYLKHHVKGKIWMDPDDPCLDGIIFNKQNWKDLYPDAEEATDPDAPDPLIEKDVQITAMVDASHGSCYDTRRSVTGYIIMVGRSIIKWYSKRQNTVESSSYGSELVAMRIAVEAILEIRYKLRMMGIKIAPTSNLLCDNQAVIINTQLPTSSLKKKHNSVAYHKCREAVAADIIRTAHISTHINVADVLTKPKSPADMYRLLKFPLYGRYDDYTH